PRPHECSSLSLHDALPISRTVVPTEAVNAPSAVPDIEPPREISTDTLGPDVASGGVTKRYVETLSSGVAATVRGSTTRSTARSEDRKSTRLNSSHDQSSYA